MKPHKHAELIKAWADGAEIECRNKNFQDSWAPLMEGCWDREFLEFRIKPQAPKPDVVQYAKVFIEDFKLQMKSYISDWHDSEFDNVKFTFDGETGELKSAEVLK